MYQANTTQGIEHIFISTRLYLVLSVQTSARHTCTSHARPDVTYNAFQFLAISDDVFFPRCFELAIEGFTASRYECAGLECSIRDRLIIMIVTFRIKLMGPRCAGVIDHINGELSHLITVIMCCF